MIKRYQIWNKVISNVPPHPITRCCCTL